MNENDLIDEDPAFPDLRARLSSLADEGSPKLTRAARERILDRVREQGPSLTRAPAPRPRWVLASSGLAALAAAAAFLLWFLAGPETTPEIATGPRCAEWSAASASATEGRFDGRFDLGRRGTAEFVGELRLGAVDGCTTELELRDGRVDVTADDLGGGALVVVAGEISVEVRGTRFSVARSGAHVEVIVREGHVVVRASGEREIHLHGGERWSRGQAHAQLDAEPSVVPEPESAAAPIPSVEPVAEPTGHAPNRPTRSASERERLAQAERFWRDGQRDAARRIFRRIGGGRGALAEAAWVRLARLELRAGEAANARAAANTQRRRFPRSRLGAEALFIQADASRRLGDREGAQRALRDLREQYPDSPQARATP